jgi:GNAT superfamily N-acetyltransferase
MRLATQQDIPLLLELMTDFYAETGYELDRATAQNAFETLVADSGLGFVWLLEADGKAVGHLVLTLKFAMEYGGLSGCLDDLFVRKAFRNRGLSSAALGELREFCLEHSIRGVTVEVGIENPAAQTVYRRAGFVELEGRQLLGLALAPPSHVV